LKKKDKKHHYVVRWRWRECATRGRGINRFWLPAWWYVKHTPSVEYGYRSTLNIQKAKRFTLRQAQQVNLFGYRFQIVDVNTGRVVKEK
jgi:hypothetical protein